MQVKQVYELVNDALKETLGDSIVLSEDLSNTVQMGQEVFNASAAHILPHLPHDRKFSRNQ